MKFAQLAALSFTVALSAQFSFGQELSVPITTVSPNDYDHQRPLIWRDYVDFCQIPFNATVELHYRIHITNTNTSPDSILGFWTYDNIHLPFIIGGSHTPTWHGCWGSDWPPPYSNYHPLPVPVSVQGNSSVVIEGVLEYPGIYAQGAGGAHCYSDGIHGPGILYHYPASGLASPTGINTFSGNPVTYVDQGSTYLHEYTLECFYDLPPIGTSSCSSANPNSTGSAASLEAFGFIAPNFNDSLVVLHATDIPSSTFALGYFLLSQGGTPGTPLTSGMGTLCISAPIYRWHASLGSAESNNERIQVLSLADLPIPGGAVSSGQVWHFQLWHRDWVSFSSTSNTTGSVAITF